MKAATSEHIESILKEGDLPIGWWKQGVPEYQMLNPPHAGKTGGYTLYQIEWGYRGGVEDQDHAPWLWENRQWVPAPLVFEAFMVMVRALSPSSEVIALELVARIADKRRDVITEWPHQVESDMELDEKNENVLFLWSDKNKGSSKYENEVSIPSMLVLTAFISMWRHCHDPKPTWHHVGNGLRVGIDDAGLSRHTILEDDGKQITILSSQLKEIVALASEPEPEDDHDRTWTHIGGVLHASRSTVRSRVLIRSKLAPRANLLISKDELEAAIKLMEK